MFLSLSLSISLPLSVHPKALSSLTTALADYKGLAPESDESYKDVLDTARLKGAQLSGIVFEGLLTTALVEDSPIDKKKKKLQEHFNKMKAKALWYETDLNSLVHPRLVREASNNILGLS